MLRTTSCLPPQTSTSGTEKTRLAPLSIPRKPQTHSGWLQDKLVTRPLYLAAQHVLKCLAATLEVRRRKINARLLHQSILHLQGSSSEKCVKTAKVHIPSDIGQLGGARDWKLAADLNQRLCFPSEIAITNLRQTVCSGPPHSTLCTS